MKTNRSKGTRCILVALLLLFLASPVSSESRGERTDSGLPTQLFTVRFKDVNDVYLLIEPFLSANGSVRMQPRLRTLAVTDSQEALQKIEELIGEFDLPPKNVEVAMQLILASTTAGNQEKISPRIRGVIKRLNEISTRWSDYQLLGSATVVSSEGEKTSIQMGEDYRIKFAVDYASEEQQLIRFDRFTLDRRKTAPDAGDLSETFSRVLDTSLNLRSDKLYIFGASRLENSNRALFMTITASLQP